MQRDEEAFVMTDILLFLMAVPVIVLAWFGVGLCVYTDGDYMMAECTECGMPMLAQLFMFLQGEI